VQGLKPTLFCSLNAGLKRRSSTTLLLGSVFHGSVSTVAFSTVAFYTVPFYNTALPCMLSIEN